MKIVFAGTPEFAVPILKKLKDSGKDIVGIITQKDKPQGRKGILTPSPVKQFALENDIPFFQPEKIREELDGVKALGGDIMITCAYGQILSQEVLDLFPKGVWNIHAGLLPFYRGASPIQSAILNGEKETGVCIMKTETGLDTGAVLLCEKTNIGEKETFGELSSRLSFIASEIILTAIEKIEKGNYTLFVQGEEGAHVYKKIKTEECLVSFSDSAEKIVNKIRAFNPEPIAFTYLNGIRVNLFKAEKISDMNGEYLFAKDGEVLCDNPKKGLMVKCVDGVVKIEELQIAGGKRMRATDFLNGRKVEKGQMFHVK